MELTRRRKSSSGRGVHSGWWKTASSSAYGTARRVASSLPSVDFPDPETPTIDTFRTNRDPTGSSVPTSQCALMAPFYEGICQGHGLAVVDGAAALVGVNVVRPVGRSTLTPRARRLGLAAAGAMGGCGKG